MGQDPKPSKRRRQASRESQLVRPGSPLPLRPAENAPDRSLPPPANSRLDREPYEPAYGVTALPQSLELLAGVEADGYFKATLGDEGKTWFLCWRWQHGTWAGHYVMARVLRGQVAFGLSLLLEKVAEVRCGVRKPTRDRYGD